MKEGRGKDMGAYMERGSRRTGRSCENIKIDWKVAESRIEARKKHLHRQPFSQLGR
jgi:hypothetical protein